MPRDANGNYTLPSGNPVVTGTPISSGGWANPTLSDLANEMQDSLSRSGKGGLTAPVAIVDGSGAVPGLNFQSEPTTGVRREASEDVRWQVTSTDVWKAVKTGVQILTPKSGGALKSPAVEESGTEVMRGVHNQTRMYFYLDTPPPWWRLFTPDANIRELVIGPSGAGQGGILGGTIDPTILTQNITVSITGTAATVNLNHTHTFSGTTSQGNLPQSSTAGGFSQSQSTHTHTYSGTTSGASVNLSHAHSVTGSGPANVYITPRYARGLLAVVNNAA